MQDGLRRLEHQPKQCSREPACSECFVRPAWVTAHRMERQGTVLDWKAKNRSEPDQQVHCLTSTRGKKLENGQRFSGVAKPSWVQTVGGTPLHDRCPIATDWVKLRSPTNIIRGLDVQSGHHNALSQHLREEWCHQKKRSIEKMWIPRLVGDVT